LNTFRRTPQYCALFQWFLPQNRAIFQDFSNLSKMNEHLRALNIEDPHLPNYHFVAGNRMNDPQPFYWNGEYHLFFNHHEHPVIRKAGRGHAVSKDLINWKLLPKAFEPTPNGSDKNGCWTGSFIEINGRFYTFYTGCVLRENPLIQTQNMAFSDDLIHWTKYEGNPLTIEKPEDLDLGDCWRDPLVWKENDEFLMILGANDTKQNVPVALLYGSFDLINWSFKLIFAKDKDSQIGFIMECPDFFKIGSTHMLISCDDIPPFDNTFWRTGSYEDNIFSTQLNGVIDIGKFYAAKTLIDDNNRRILFGWVKPTRTNEALVEAKWSGAMSLPREISIQNDRFIIKPVKELENLRVQKRRVPKVQLLDNKPVIVGELSGNSLEIIIDCSLEKEAVFKILLFTSTDFEYFLPIEINQKNSKINNQKVSFRLDKCIIHIFIDNSILEVFLNYSICYTENVYSDYKNIAFQQLEGRVQLNSIDAWELNSQNEFP
jgi:beta-fructofuranosidase